MYELSVCAGIGGLSLGLRDAIDCRTIAYVEREAYAAAILAKQMEAGALDAAPIWSDLRTFPAQEFRGGVDIVSAGFPCQPFSTASRGRKTAVDLWPEVLRVIDEVETPWVFLENVQREPIERAGQDLELRGYQGVAAPIRSSHVGAPHDRVRWWLLAHTHDAEQPAIPVHDEVASLQKAERPDWWANHPGELLGMDDGIPHRVDQLRALGNAVVPAQAAHAFRVLHGRLFE